MKKLVLFLSVISITTSLMAVDIMTRTPGKKPKPQKEVTAEVEKQAEAKEAAVNAIPYPVPESTICPVTGVPLKVNTSTPFSNYSNVRYYFLSANEKVQFDGNPFKFAKDIETCQVCGRQEKKTRGKSSFVEASYNGKTYRFCTVLHSQGFEKEPAKFIRGSESYSTKQIGKKKVKTPVKAGEKQGEKKDAEEEDEILAEETIPATPAKTPEVKEPKKEEKPVVTETKKDIPEVKLPVKAAAPLKKEATPEIEEIIMEE